MNKRLRSANMQIQCSHLSRIMHGLVYLRFQYQCDFLINRLQNVFVLQLSSLPFLRANRRDIEYIDLYRIASAIRIDWYR